MSFKKTYLLIYFILIGIGVFSQTQKQLINVGDESFRIGDYLGASIYYKKAMKFDSTDVQLLYSYAEALRKDKNYEKAEFYYQKVYKKDGGRDIPKAVFWLATMQKYNGKHIESYKNWKTVKTLFRNGKLYTNKKTFAVTKVFIEFKSKSVIFYLLTGSPYKSKSVASVIFI